MGGAAPEEEEGLEQGLEQEQEEDEGEVPPQAV